MERIRVTVAEQVMPQSVPSGSNLQSRLIRVQASDPAPQITISGSARSPMILPGFKSKGSAPHHERLPRSLSPTSQASTGSTNNVNALRLKYQLGLAEQRAMFTSTGELSKAAIENSRSLPLNLQNKSLLKELSKRPGNLGDWMKYVTQPIHTENGLVRMHFYKNPITNDIFYDMDYKAVFDHNGLWKLEISPKFDYEPLRFNP